MICLDTNVFVYIANGTLNPKIVASADIAHSSICRIEALGYHRLVVTEEQRLEALFNESNEISLSAEIVKKAIYCRRNYNLRLGDSIIAATALETNIELWTAHEKDFKDIDGLKIYNPLKG